MPAGFVEEDSSPSVFDHDGEFTAGAFLGRQHHDGLFSHGFGFGFIVQNIMEIVPSIISTRAFKTGFDVAISSVSHSHKSQTPSLLDVIEFFGNGSFRVEELEFATVVAKRIDDADNARINGLGNVIAFLQKLDFFFFGNFVKVVVDLVNDFNPLFFNFSNGE